jgi:hypothetical protein
MWSIEPVTGTARAVAAATLLAAVAGSVWLEELGDRLRREEHRAWWAGHGRDVINVLALLAIAGALRLHGFPGPAALPERFHPRVLALCAAFLLALPLLCWPGDVVAMSGQVAAALFPTG